MSRTIILGPWVAGTVVTLLSATAAAQGVVGEGVFPGASVASSQGAESARTNPAGVTVQRSSSVRLTHVEDLRRGPSGLHSTVVGWTTGLPFGLGISLGATWIRPNGLATDADDRVGSHGTFELGLGYALDRRLSIGARWRLHAGFDDRAAGLDGRSSLDVGALYRLSSRWAFGASVRGLVGPNDRALGEVRSAAVGVAVRPDGRDTFTLGVDGALTWEGDPLVRGAARVAVPGFGFVRAEGVTDFQGGWRASAGVEVSFGQTSVGVAGFGGTSEDRDVTGLVATLGWEGDRTATSIPTGNQVVTIEMNSSLGTRSFARLLIKVDRLRRDPNVRGVLFAPRAEVGGLAHAEELREVFARLRGAGIRVACHLTESSASTWYACSGVDRVVLDPAGGVRIAGIRSARYFLGGALWDLGVRTDFVRIGDYKSAPEQLTETASTAAARAQEDGLLDDWSAVLTAAIGRSRNLTNPEAARLVTGGPYTSRDAREAHLVDAIATLSVTQRAMANSLHASRVDLDDYDVTRSRRWSVGEAVAVIYVDGDIVDGASSSIPFLGMPMAGDRTLVEAIEAAAGDSRVGAIVLRIDSPGGSALASDLIWRAVATAARRKPVIASMGRIAASGGYYIASAAREIFADPSTLTGSIGIFYGKADISRLLARLNVGVELARRGERADMESIFRAYTPEERRFLANRIGEFYNLFLSRVSAGRHRTPQEIDAVGSGRVFVGARAHQNGLVDTEGGLLSAIVRARALAHLPVDADVLELPAESGGLLRTVSQLLGRGESGGSVIESLLERPELRVPLGWLLTVTSHHDQPMAMTEYPVMVP